MVIDKLKTKPSNFGVHFTEKCQKPHWGIFDEAMELTSVDFLHTKIPHGNAPTYTAPLGLHTALQISVAISCLSPQLPHHKASCHQLSVPTTTSPQGKLPSAVCPHKYLTTRQAAISCLSPQLPLPSAVCPHNYLTTRQAAISCLSPQLPHHKASCHRLSVPTTTSPQGKLPSAVCPHNYLTARQAAIGCLSPQLPHHKASCHQLSAPITISPQCKQPTTATVAP